ncbi:MAG: hypothetical protein PVH88_17470 [Ignavibacteria bacterium]|jgi:hypothetical protein
MGAIVYWTLIRIAILIPILWLAIEWMDYKFWWTISIMAVYGVVIYPAYLQYKIFRDKNKEIIFDTLCSSCKSFDETAVICMKYDEHPKVDYIPCEGSDWEPKG